MLNQKKLDLNNYKGDLDFIKNTQDVYFSLEVMVDVASYEIDDPELAYRIRDKKTNSVIHLWSHEKFKERLELMRDWHADMEDGVANKIRINDPWQDIMDGDEQDLEETQLMNIDE